MGETEKLSGQFWGRQVGEAVASIPMHVDTELSSRDATALTRPCVSTRPSRVPWAVEPGGVAHSTRRTLARRDTMVAPARCLSSSTLVARLDAQTPHRRFAPRVLMVRNVASGTPAPVAAKRLGIALGAAATGAAGLAVATVAMGQGVDVVQMLAHVPQDIWGVYQSSLLTHPLQTKVWIRPALRPSLPGELSTPCFRWGLVSNPHVWWSL